MDKKYIVLHANEDGEHRLYLMTEQEIKDDFLAEECPINIAQEIPRDLGYFIGLLIIDGKIVIPKPIEKATDWEL